LKKKFNNIGRKVFLLCAFFMFALVQTANASYVIINDGIISEKVLDKIETMGSELYRKTSVSVYLAVPKDINGQSIVNYGQNLSKELKTPYVLLTLAKNEHQVDIIYSKSLEGKLDKDSILSPFPWSGTIIPLLSGKKGNDNYNAAMLNGYADIIERVAENYDVELESAIGNTNKDILHYVKYGIMLFLLFIFIQYILKKVRKKND